MGDRMHAREIVGHEGRIDGLATEVGRLTYDRVSDFLGALAMELIRQSEGDQLRGRNKLASSLDLAAEDVLNAKSHIDAAWAISKPHLKHEELETASLSDRLRAEEVVSYQPVTLRGGEESTFYADIKKAYGSPELLAAMAGVVLGNLDPRTTCIAASGYGGVPLGTVVSQQSRLPLVLVRDEEKAHGRGGLVDGYVPSGSDRVSIVDDVFTSGSSLRRTEANLAGTEAEILGCHVVVARSDTSKFKLPVSYLLSIDDLTHRSR